MLKNGLPREKKDSLDQFNVNVTSIITASKPKRFRCCFFAEMEVRQLDIKKVDESFESKHQDIYEKSFYIL